MTEGLTVPAYMRPVMDALARGEKVRLLTWDEQRRLQRAAYAHVMAKHRAMLLLISMQDQPAIIVNDDREGIK